MKSKHSMNNLGKLCAGIAAASFAAASIAETRYWASEAESASFNAVESWEPAPASMDEVANDTLILNKGTDKVAVLESGDDVTVANLTVGKGSNGAGRFDMAGGKLTVSDKISIGDSSHTTGSGVFNISGGSLNSKNIELKAKSGSSAKLTVSSGASIVLSNQLRVGYSSNSTGEVEISGASVSMESELILGNETGSFGKMHLSGDANLFSRWAVYIGKKGVGELTIDGGQFTSDISVNFGDNDNSAVEGNVLNLNGGVLKTAEFRSKYVPATINWNGGVITGCRDSRSYVTSGVVFNSNDSSRLTINVMQGGAIYESVGDGRTYQMNVPLSGPGAIVKRGADKLTINGALDVKGGIKVEGGTLNVANLARTVFKELSVAADTTLELDLGGRIVTVEKYVLNGEEKGAGTYSAFNGTIRVLSAEEKVPASAVWTNAAGDNDVTNPDNWAVKNAAGDELLSLTAPGADTPVTVYYDANIPSFDGYDNVTFVFDKNITITGYDVPAIVNDAAAWYDPSDTGKLIRDDNNKVVEIANKGTAGADLDLERRTTGKSGVELSTEGFNGRQSIYYNGGSGYRSKKTFPGGLVAGVERTLFTVAKGDNNNMVMLSVARKADSNDEGRHLLMVHSNWGRGYKVGVYKDNGWTGETVNFKSTEANNAYVFAGRTSKVPGGGADERTVISSVMGASGDARVSTPASFTMTEGQNNLDYRVYYGAFEIGIGWVDLDSNGYQGEALIFTKALTDDEMEAVNDYLRMKWLGELGSELPKFDNIICSANVGLGGLKRTFGNISGNGSFEDGTVVLNGDLEITVNANGSVVAPSFDKLVLGSTARLVVKGAGNLPKNTVGLKVVQFNSLEGEFSAIVNDTGDKVSVAYTEGGVNAMRTPGAMLLIR